MLCCVAQMNSKKDVTTNLREAEQLIEKASKKDVKLLVLPEMFACLGVANQYEMAASRFTEKDVLATLAGWSKKYQMYLVAGSMPMTSTNTEEMNQANKVHAACLVFSPQGKQIASYNKIHLFDVDVADEKGSYKESDTFIAGQSPEVAEIGDIKLGLTICYDLRFPELFQYYMAENCQIMTVPSAFTYQTGKAHWEVLLRARAIENQCYVVGANQGGVHTANRRTWGHSIIVDPWGDTLGMLDQGPSVLVREIEIHYLRQLRGNMPIQQHKAFSVINSVNMSEKDGVSE